MNAPRTMLFAALFSSACWLCDSGLARADVLPECAAGQHLQVNPTAPGSMHHGGGQCVDDAPAAAAATTSSSCSASPRGSSRSAAGALLLTVAAIALGSLRRLRR